MRRLALAATVLLSSCATLGTNVSGRFACTAPKGGCAPTSVIDEGATGAVSTSTLDAAAVLRRTTPGGDAARTGERVLRIVFPAHVDAQGTLHEESIAYAVAEGPDWAVAKRGRALSAQPVPTPPQLDDESANLSSPPLISRDASPSTPREVLAGATAPAIEGFDASSPLDARTPRSFDPSDLPSDAAIDAAKARAKQKARK